MGPWFLGCTVRGGCGAAAFLQPDFEFDSISDHHRARHPGLGGPHDPDHAALTDLATELGLNVWAVEDAVAPSERVKATIYPGRTPSSRSRRGHGHPGPHGRSGLVADQAPHLGLRPRSVPWVTVRLAPQFDIEGGVPALG